MDVPVIGWLSSIPENFLSLGRGVKRLHGKSADMFDCPQI
jgi:hypothetical protein